MSFYTSIEWTNASWNPVTGCRKISPGCGHCYAEVITHRFPSRFPNGFDITLHPERLHQPRHWKAPRLVFVNSMSDLFHKDIPDDFLVDVWATMLATPQHTYQILTKRPHRMAHKVRTLKLTIRFFVEPGQAVVALEHGYRESQVTVPQASITPTPPSLRCQPLNRDEGLHYVTLMDANDRRTTTAPFHGLGVAGFFVSIGKQGTRCLLLTDVCFSHVA